MCIRTICTEGSKLSGASHKHPEISLHIIPLAHYMRHLDKGEHAHIAEDEVYTPRQEVGGGVRHGLVGDVRQVDARRQAPLRRQLPVQEEAGVDVGVDA